MKAHKSKLAPGIDPLALNRLVDELEDEAILGKSGSTPQQWLVESWLARPRVHVLVPGPRHLEIAFALLRRLGTAANLTADVQIAALAMEHQAELHSNDSDFARFPGLRWVNPLD